MSEPRRRTSPRGKRSLRPLLWGSSLLLSLAIVPTNWSLYALRSVRSPSVPFRISRVAGGALIDGEALQVPQRPFAVAVSSHFLYVADALHNVIRRIDVLTGKESTAVGSGTARSISDGALPLSVGLYGPSGVATDQYGDLLISDSGNRRVLVVPGRNRRLFGMQMIGGRVYQLTGRGVGNGVTIENPWGITVDEQGDAIFVDSQTGTIWLTAAESGRGLWSYCASRTKLPALTDYEPELPAGGGGNPCRPRHRGHRSQPHTFPREPERDCVRAQNACRCDIYTC